MPSPNYTKIAAEYGIRPFLAAVRDANRLVRTELPFRPYLSGTYAAPELLDRLPAVRYAGGYLYPGASAPVPLAVRTVRDSQVTQQDLTQVESAWVEFLADLAVGDAFEVVTDFGEEEILEYRKVAPDTYQEWVIHSDLESRWESDRAAQGIPWDGFEESLRDRLESAGLPADDRFIELVMEVMD